MSKRGTILLALVAAALVSYVVIFERTSLTSKELDERKGRVLGTFVREKVDRLEVQRKGKQVVLERARGAEGEFESWKLLAPEAGSADQDAVDQVLGELEWLSARRTLEQVSDADAKKFGLATPRYRVRFRAGGVERVLVVGNADVHGDGVYVRVDREPVAFVVPKTLVEALDHAPGHFRDKEFLGEMTIAWARRIELASASGEKVELVKDGGRFWVAAEPKSYADTQRIDTLLRALDDLRAARFLEADERAEASADLAKPARVLRVRIVPDEGREDRDSVLVELQLGGPCKRHEGERYARAGSEGSPVCIQAEDARAFESTTAELREPRLFSADPSEIESLTLRYGNIEQALKRDGEKWVSAGVPNVDREAVEHWLHELAEQRASAFSPVGPFEERASLTLSLVGDKKQRVGLGQVRPDGSVYVRRDQEPVLVSFPPSVAQLLEPQTRRFASLAPWSGKQPSDVVGIEVRDGAIRRSLVLEGGTFRTAPKGPEPSDAQRLRELVRDLVKLEAVAFVSDAPRPGQGLDAPSSQLSLRLASGNALELALGASDEHGTYARMDGGAVYLVSAATVGQLKELAGTGKAPVASDAGLPEDDHGHGHEEHL